MEEYNENERQEIYSERVRAGKRTYFFDVKVTKTNDYYLTITEKKKRYKDGGHSNEKYRIFLYKEDFNKFVKGLNNTVNYVKNELMPDVDFDEFDREREAAYIATQQKKSENESGTNKPSDDTIGSESSDSKWD